MSRETTVFSSIEDLSPQLTSLRDTLRADPPDGLSGVVGFDGFVDTFIRMRSPASMAEFGPKVTEAAGIAASYSVDHEGDKFGGNGPLFASALKGILGKGTEVAYIGGIGHGEAEPLFSDALSGTLDRLVPLAPPAHSDCLEFTDGKIMLSDLDACAEITLERLREVMGDEGIDEVLRGADYVSAVNWGKLPKVGEIWSHLAERLRALGREPKQVRFFMDLAEFEHRDEDDVRGLLERLGPITEQCATTLSFNLKEAWQLADRFGGGFHGKKDPESVAALAALLQDHVQVDHVIVHPNSGSAGATRDHCVFVPGPYCQNPKISTGAGDHFGAGVLAAGLCGLDLPSMLLVGNATSGYFVRSGRTPDLGELGQFFDSWAAGSLPERL